MKDSLCYLAMGAGVVLVALSATGCKLNSNSAPSTVKSSFFMTGSGNNAVVQSDTQKLFSLIIPSAIALTPPLLVDANGLAVNLNNAWIVIKEIEFKTNEVAGTNEINEREIEFTGPYFVDLLSNAPASFGDAILPEVGIRRVKMQLHGSNNIPASAPLGLAGNSMYLTGTVNNVAFSYASVDSTEFDIGGPNPILPSSSKDLLAVIRMANLLKKIDLSSITTATNISANNRVLVINPCPLIDTTSADLYSCFRKGFSTEANFGNDNGKKDLDANDDTVRK
jgi:hypothetical protein